MPLEIKRDSKLKSGANLIIVQLGLYLIPLITMPYIVKTVGIDNYGKYFFFQAVMGLLSVIGNYGFVISGVRDIAVCKNLEAINREYSRIFYSKLFTLSISVLIGLALFYFNKFSAERTLYAYSFLFLIVTFLDISFVYQGIEKLKDYVNINLIGSIVILVFLFLVIKEPKDYVYLPIVFLLPRVIAALLSIYLLYCRFKIVPNNFALNGIKEKIRNNFLFFVTTILSMLYTNATMVMLGLLASNIYVGYYALADQLINAYSNIQGKVSAVYQPQIASAFKNSLSEGISKAKENMLVIFMLAIAGCIFTQFFGYDILYVLFKEHAKYSETALKILSFNFISIHSGSILAIQILLSLHKEKDFLKPSIFAVILNLTMGSILIFYFKHIGAAISVVLIEIMIFVYLYAKTKSYGIEVLDRRLIQRLINYTFSIVSLLVFLKFLYHSININIYIKLLTIISLYGLSILLILKLLGIVDFRKRKVII